MKRTIALILALVALLASCHTSRGVTTTTSHETHVNDSLNINTQTDAGTDLSFGAFLTDSQSCDITFIIFAPPAPPAPDVSPGIGQPDTVAPQVAAPAPAQQAQIVLPNGTSITGNVAQMGQIHRHSTSTAQNTMTESTHERTATEATQTINHDSDSAAATTAPPPEPRRRGWGMGETIVLALLIGIVIAGTVYLKRHR